jgi:5-(carboxyamino)imidazole ribonucleotide synthase
MKESIHPAANSTKRDRHKSVGIIGGGQLARMLTLAGVPLGLNLRVFDPSSAACAGQVAPLTCGAFADATALLAFARDLDVLTFDFENVPGSTLEALSADIDVAPNPKALIVSQDRLLEKQTFSQLGIPVAPYAAVESHEQMTQAIRTLGVPGILKTRTLGYDGKGQIRVRKPSDAASAFDSLALAPCVYEQMVAFDRELSIIAVRSTDGEFCSYPLTENVHDEGILAVSIAPAKVDDSLAVRAQQYAQKVAEYFNYVGVFALEFFQVDGQLIVNEMAPRVHNSGHWSIEGTSCSQFQNHLRAVTGMPLGKTAPQGVSIMLNWVGEMPESGPFLSAATNFVRGCAWHDYGKSAREGRKVGHCTITADRLDDIAAFLRNVQCAQQTRAGELALKWLAVHA